MMHITEVIKKPILTEKTYALMQNNCYTFLVDVRASKQQIKHAFENIFEVQVATINVINCHPQAKRVGRFKGTTSRTKKAMIRLLPGEKFDLFHDQK